MRKSQHPIETLCKGEGKEIPKVYPNSFSVRQNECLGNKA